MTSQKILGHDFILCFFAQFAFQSVFTILIPTMPIYLSRFEAKEAEIGFLVGISSLSSVILRPIVGRGLLKVPEKNFMIAGTLLCLFSSIAYLFAPPFWPFLVVRICHGIALAFFATAIYTQVVNIIPEMRRGQLTSYFFLSVNISWALGPYLGMVLINQFSFVVLFLVGTGLSFCSLLVTTKLSKRRGILLENQSSKAHSILSREALPSSIIAFMLAIIWGTLATFFPLHALRHGVSNPGIFFVFLAITLILGRILGGKVLDVHDRKKVAILCFTAIMISLAILTLSTTLPMFILAAVILGMGWALLFPLLLILAIENVGAARSPAVATFTGFTDLGTGIGPIIMGVILQWTSYTIMFFCLTVVGVINFLYFYYAISKRRIGVDQMMMERSKERIA